MLLFWGTGMGSLPDDFQELFKVVDIMLIFHVLQVYCLAFSFNGNDFLF